MRAITGVSKEKSTISTYLVVETSDKKVVCLIVVSHTQYYFSGFFKNHLEEALNIIRYLSNNPISYIDLACAVPDPVPVGLTGFQLFSLFTFLREKERKSS